MILTSNRVIFTLKYNIFNIDVITDYIYIYIRKNKSGHIRVINLFPSCYVFLI